MPIKTLENTSIAEITAAFNEAFSDYMIKMQWTEADALRKFKADNIDLSLSPGYFVDGKLCGFIHHFVGTRDGQPIVWNGGTGVVPGQRGQGLTNQLYQFILPKLRNKGFTWTVLEVIEGNDPAIHTYQKNGFEQVRMLECYSGTPIETELPAGIHLKEIEEIDWSLFHSFRSWQPTFQNNDTKIIRFRKGIKVIGAFKGEILTGYILIVDNSEKGDVFQFAVHPEYRRKGIAKALFYSVFKQKTVPLKVINIDAGNIVSNLFLERIGMKKMVRQFEMLKYL